MMCQFLISTWAQTDLASYSITVCPSDPNEFCEDGRASTLEFESSTCASSHSAHDAVAQPVETHG